MTNKNRLFVKCFWRIISVCAIKYGEPFTIKNKKSSKLFENAQEQLNAFVTTKWRTKSRTENMFPWEFHRNWTDVMPMTKQITDWRKFEEKINERK